MSKARLIIEIEGDLDRLMVAGKLGEILTDLAEGKTCGTWHADNFTGRYEFSESEQA